MKENRDRDSAVRIRTGGLWRMLCTAYHRAVHPPELLVRLKGDPGTLYPSMSRGEIRRVAQAICKSALRNAK